MPSELLGYWWRFGPAKGAKLHLAKYLLTDGTLTFEAACGAVCAPDTVGMGDQRRERFRLQPTAQKALDCADSNQHEHACSRCLKRLGVVRG
jgi:hypothetical protein